MRTRIILSVFFTGCFVTFIVILMSSGGDAEKAMPVEIVQSSDCQTCHEEVYAEWESSWHAKAWLDPLVRDKKNSDNFKKKDCIPCHAPRPIFERGFRPGERVVERLANRDDGVDCLACHKLPEGGIAAANPGTKGPCKPVYHPGLSSEALCAPCHNQHNTVDEWLAAPPHLKGESCNECHMPLVERNESNNRSRRQGRDHSFLGGHAKDLLMNAFSLDYEIGTGESQRVLRVRLINDKTGHNLPTDSRHRALDLIVTLYKAGGLPYPSLDGDREFGQEPGTFRLRFRNPYRSEYGKENTQIPAGQEAVLEAPLPEEAKKARIQVIYKLTPFLLDEEGEELVSKEITF